jgi:aryl-alcohol dehydrogenase-like predicted oxidoreductase
LVTLAPGIEAPSLIPGCNTFGGRTDETASFAVLDAFADPGGRMIDTADMYSNWVPGHSGDGSEEVIGRRLRQS